MMFLPAIFSGWNRIKFFPESVDFTVDPYSGLISRRENYDSTIRKNLLPFSTRRSPPILYGGKRFIEGQVGLFKIENLGLSYGGGSCARRGWAIPDQQQESLLQQLYAQGDLKWASAEEVDGLSEFGAEGAVLNKLCQMVNLTAAESFITNYCTTYLYRFLKVPSFVGHKSKLANVVLSASFYTSCGVAVAGKFFDDAAVASRTLFSPVFYMLAFKAESAIAAYSGGRLSCKISSAGILILVTRKLAYLTTRRAIEGSAFLPTPNLAISNLLFFMKLCRAQAGEVKFSFSINECRRALFSRAKLIIKGAALTKLESVASKSLLLKTRVLSAKLAKNLGTLELSKSRSASIKSLILETAVLEKEFKCNSITSTFNQILPPRKISLDRGRNYHVNEQSVARLRAHKGVGALVNSIFDFEPGLLSFMEKSEGKNALFKALTPIKRLDYYRETDDTYTAAGAIPKRRELLRRMRAAREDRKRTHELFTANVAGEREGILKLFDDIQELRSEVKRFANNMRTLRSQKLLNIVTLSYKFVRAASKKIKSNKPVRADGRLVGALMRRVRKLVKFPGHIFTRRAPPLEVALALRKGLVALLARKRKKFDERVSLKEFLVAKYFALELGLGFRVRALSKFLMAEHTADGARLRGAVSSFPVIFTDAFGNASEFISDVRLSIQDLKFNYEGQVVVAASAK